MCVSGINPQLQISNTTVCALHLYMCRISIPRLRFHHFTSSWWMRHKPIGKREKLLNGKCSIAVVRASDPLSAAFCRPACGSCSSLSFYPNLNVSNIILRKCSGRSSYGVVHVGCVGAVATLPQTMWIIFDPRHNNPLIGRCGEAATCISEIFANHAMPFQYPIHIKKNYSNMFSHDWESVRKWFAPWLTLVVFVDKKPICCWFVSKVGPTEYNASMLWREATLRNRKDLII